MESRQKRLLALALVTPVVLGMALWEHRHATAGSTTLLLLPLVLILIIAALLLFRGTKERTLAKRNPIAGLAGGLIALVVVWWERLRRQDTPLEGQEASLAPMVVAGILLLLLVAFVLLRLFKRDKEQMPR